LILKKRKKMKKIDNLLKPFLSLFKHDCKNCPGCTGKSINIKIVHKEKK